MDHFKTYYFLGGLMKKCFAALVLSLGFSLSVSAYPVFLFPSCFNGPSMGECHLINTSREIVNCSIQAQGQTMRGGLVTAFENVTLYQGMYAWIRVYAYNPGFDPLVFMRADAFCNTIN